MDVLVENVPAMIIVFIVILSVYMILREAWPRGGDQASDAALKHLKDLQTTAEKEGFLLLHRNYRNPPKDWSRIFWQQEGKKFENRFRFSLTIDAGFVPEDEHFPGKNEAVCAVAMAAAQGAIDILADQREAICIEITSVDIVARPLQ